jgi:hypothetical protein
VGAFLALFFVVVSWPSPAQAAPPWKEAIADIEEIRDVALTDLYDAGAEFTEFLEDEPSAEEAAARYFQTLEHLQAAARGAIDQINATMGEFPDRQAVQDAGTFAKGLINAAAAFAEEYAAFQFNEYVEQLGGSPSSPVTTTTTTLLSTSTTIPPSTTSTSSPTTTVPRQSTTTTARPVGATTTTSSTTTTTIPGRVTTTTTTSTTLVIDGEGALPPGASDQGSSPIPSREQSPLTLGGGDEDYLAAGSGSASSTGSFVEPGLSVSLSRLLEPLLPAQVTDVVVSPLFMLELLWRAISTSGQGLVAPISLLLFSLLSLLRDRRRVNLETAESPG